MYMEIAKIRVPLSIVAGRYRGNRTDEELSWGTSDVVVEFSEQVVTTNNNGSSPINDRIVSPRYF